MENKASLSCWFDNCFLMSLTCFTESSLLGIMPTTLPNINRLTASRIASERFWYMPVFTSASSLFVSPWFILICIVSIAMHYYGNVFI